MKISKFILLMVICFIAVVFVSCTTKGPCSSDTTAIPETMPQLLSGFDTNYPPLARQAGVEGIVGVKSVIDDKGRVQDLQLTRSSGSTAGFEQTVIESGKQNIWIPAYSLRGAIPYWSYYEVIFINRRIKMGQSSRQDHYENGPLGNPKTCSDSVVEINPVYDIPPTIEKTVAVLYTEEDSQDDISGSVWLRAIVDDSGKVRNAVILSSSLNDSQLENDLLMAFYNYTYNPAWHYGKQVAVQIECEIVFGQSYIWTSAKLRSSMINSKN